MLISLIICTHNPRPHYLRRVLDALRAQTLPVDKWELLVIDNASDEPLTVDNCALGWHPQPRIVREERFGMALARLRGMQEAAAEILVFVGDDNVLAPNYLANALRLGREWPVLGVWGSGSITPEFEVPPPDQLNKYLHMLALRDVQMPLWTNVSSIEAMPWGAGQCLRSRVALAYREHFEKSIVKINSANSRGKPPFHGGEDVEIGYVACSFGLGIGVFPELKLVHLIPKERLNEDYIVRLLEGVSVSNVLLDYDWRGRGAPNPLGGVLGVPRMIRNLLRRKSFERRLYVAELRGQLRARALILEHTPPAD
jgi:glycosyltransferase involved in cell wall biosynthesis